MTLKNIKMYPEAPCVKYIVTSGEVKVVTDDENSTILKTYKDDAAKTFCREHYLGLYGYNLARELD